MSVKMKINGFQLPEGISNTGDLAAWLKKKSGHALSKIDRGDPLDPPSKEVRAKDGKLDRIEIFNTIVDEYQLATEKSVRAGLNKDWKGWEQYQKQRDNLAQIIQELGWRPVFHISDREYQKRIVDLIRREPPRDLASLQRLFQLGWSNWAQGGLCFAYPDGFKESWREFTAEETVKACKSHDLASWGECNGATLKKIFNFPKKFIYEKTGRTKKYFGNFYHS